MNPVNAVEMIMTAFAESTGLSKAEKPPRRYLWTDSFAVCNFLELFRRTGGEIWRQLALQLVDQVHSVLGRHREDDPRTGWISGLTEEEGREHPTRGGLRIGKPVNERKPSDPFDERLEWERDGQYYHYLTKWMHALNRVSRLTGNPIFNSWAIELAKAAHAGFVHVSRSGSIRMYWKASIDLSYPLVSSMGQHDPLDGLITYYQLQATAVDFSWRHELDLGPEIVELAALCEGKNWATDDPLGIGGLLCDAYKVLQMIVHRNFEKHQILKDLLESSVPGLDAFSESRSSRLPAEYRLAFRELGLSIGLHAVERIEEWVENRPDVFSGTPSLHRQVKELREYGPLIETIEGFWLEPPSRKAPIWMEHQDINSVMLATSLAPDGYLEL